MSACPSSPPAALSKPGPRLAKCEPSDDRTQLTKAIALWFRGWCRERRMSDRDVAITIDVQLHLAQSKLNGSAGITLTDIGKFPARYRPELMHQYLAIVDAHERQVGEPIVRSAHR